MCGINAVFDPDRTIDDPEAVVAAMNADMVYRGPDGEGIVRDGPTTLGMRRLSIIDIGGGQQPLFNEDRSISLVCNGEIYNFVELRAELESRGHVFSTKSDCEVIVHLYEEVGVRAVDQLRGMFAFTLWDRRNQLLVAARDRLGIKPLYLARRGHTVALSSELKTLIRAGVASREVDRRALLQTLRFTYPVSENRTIARDVERVGAGELLEIDARGVRRRTYWRPAWASATAPSSDSEIAAELQTAVGIHLRSDVPVTVLLSGGLDSALVAALARRGSNNISALGVGYAGHPANDERLEARETARLIGMNFREIELDAREFPSAFEDLGARCDEPACDISSMAQWALYRRCREENNIVVLSGLGGDEIFFGYPTWNAVGEQMARAARLHRRLGNRLDGLAERVGDRFPAGRRRAGAYWPGPWTGLDRSGIMTDLEYGLQTLGNRGTLEMTAGLESDVLDVESRALRGPDAIYSFLLSRYLPNNGFALADRLGMGNSVEVRVPLADHALVERVIGLPLNRRFRSGVAKPLMKKLTANILPREVARRPKRGFSPPAHFVGEVIRNNADRVLDAEWTSTFFARASLEDAFRGYRDKTQSGGEPNPRYLWLLYNLAAVTRALDLWARR